MNKTPPCPACGSAEGIETSRFGRFNTRKCGSCNHMTLDRMVSPTQSDDYVVADDAAVRRMLKSTRDKEFDLSVRLAGEHVHLGPWLDIGCSFGWFMEHIERADFAPYGVEPSPTAFQAAVKTFPNKVLNGEFPVALEGAAHFPSRFEVLSTMDVLEHIQDPAPFLKAAHQSLAPGGVLLVKVPSNDGILFRLATAISSRSRNGLLGRLWQVDFNYPHWHYYSRQSLCRMLERNGFSVVRTTSIPFAFFTTAHERVRNYDGNPESIAVIGIKTGLAYLLIAASHFFRCFDNVVIIAKSATPPPLQK